MFLLRSLSVRVVRVLGGFSYGPLVKLNHLSINQSVASTAFAISLTPRTGPGPWKHSHLSSPPSGQWHLPVRQHRYLPAAPSWSRPG